MNKYIPELGQAVFGRLYKQYECIESILKEEREFNEKERTKS